MACFVLPAKWPRTASSPPWTLRLGSVRRPLHLRKDGWAGAFGEHCAECPLREACTSAARGRTIRVPPKHELLSRTRAHQAEPSWRAEYQATRPKVERRLGHMMRCKHGGRYTRVRGRVRVGHDFSVLAAGTNLKRLAVLGVRWSPAAGTWQTRQQA